MQLKAIALLNTISLVAISGLVATVNLLVLKPAHAQTRITPKESCMNQILYGNASFNGTTYVVSTDINHNIALQACHPVKVEAEAADVKRCMNQLLYTTVSYNGTPYAVRTIANPETAANICSDNIVKQQAAAMRKCIALYFAQINPEKLAHPDLRAIAAQAAVETCLLDAGVNSSAN